MGADRVFVDTNVLVYALREVSPLHDRARTAILRAEQAAEVWISWQVLRELCRTLLRPEPFGAAVSPQMAANTTDIISSRFNVAGEDAAVTKALIRLVRERSLPASLIHDANIIATMQVMEISRLLTHNVADFSRFNEVQILPLV